MDEATLKILERTLVASPADWELRVHLMTHYLGAGLPRRAAELLQAAPAVPESEDAQLVAAQVLVATDGDQALALLQRLLAANRGCARAYLLLARLYLKRGLLDEARRKYGAATVIDESLADPELEQSLSLPAGAPPAVPSLAPAQGPAAEAPVTPQEMADALAAVQSDPDIVGPTAKFSDIGGMTDVIERIRMTIVYPFKNPDLFKKFKRRPGGGILMYGPPGCGKTHIARATAGECEANFMSIAITDVLSKWLGQSERHLHELFETARRRSPTVIFIDEVDAIGVNRGESSNTMAPIVNVLLTEMDGIASQNAELMVLAATNAPWRVDSALRRPGRFDRVIFVPPPDEAAREAILRIHLAGIPAEALDLHRLAQATKRFSGADLRAVVERATEAVIAQEMLKGPGGVLTQKLLMEAVKQMRPSTSEWLETARSYASYANQSGLYDDLAEYLDKD
jgi:AAA+ superfamily predicted ATPase/thioredoxin-like negative regulator of GroEL